MMPRIAAPEGARSARAFDGTPLPGDAIATADSQTTAFDAALESEETAAETPVVHDETDYRTDLQDAFPHQTNGDAPDLNGIESPPPLGISLEKDGEEAATNGFEAYAPAGFEEADENPDPYTNLDYDADEQADIAAMGADVTGADVIEGEQLFADDGAGGDDGGEPPTATALSTSGSGRPDTPKDQEQGLFEHLNELRARLLHAMLGVIAVMAITWSYTYQLQDWFAAPIRAVLNQNGIKKGDLVLLGAPEAFTLYFQFSLTSALIIAMPWVLFQVWRFVEPALTNSERRYTLVLVPFSSTLFFLGAGLGYACAPLFFKFFLEYQPPGVLAQWKYDDSIILMAKMLLIFGLAFQVPIIIIFGHKIGLISRNLLIEYWRHAVVVIFIVVAVLTPTWDPVTMTACALPPCLLYLLSIWLVKWL